MFDSSSGSSSTPMRSSICLEYGVDESDCDSRELEVSERGMRFQSRWCFSLGTQLVVSIPRPEGDQEGHKIKVEGIVVECEKTACCCYRTLLLFLDLPASDLDALRALAASGNFATSTGGG
jgi:hypothetical protein